MSPKATILIVEDEDAVRSVLVRALQREGYEVYENNGATPVDFDAFGQLDVLITDIGLPHQNGYAVAQRCHVRWPECQTILISGHSPEELERRGIPPDAAIVQKPIALSDLFQMIDKLLTLRGWRKLRTDDE